MFTPDYTKFINQVNKTDLARPNLFLVRFGDFRQIISNDGIIDFASSIIPTDGASNLNPVGNDNYSWQLAQRGIANAAYSHLPPQVRQILNSADELGVVETMFGAGLNNFLDGNYRLNSDLALMVKAVNMPSKSFDYETITLDRKKHGHVRSSQNGTLTMTLYCSPDFIERRLMMMWMQVIHNEEQNTYGFHDVYAREINVASVNRKGVVSSLVAMKNCFPIRVSEIQLDTDQNNSVATFDVEFYVGQQKHLDTLIFTTASEAL
ncbi:TPA: hypothetical protein ACGUM0_004130 [Vibrio vulnificus]